MGAYGKSLFNTYFNVVDELRRKQWDKSEGVLNREEKREQSGGAERQLVFLKETESSADTF